MTLYLKYRPKNLDELDLKDVSDSLNKIVASGKVPHAFLFSGPKGTGKTSAARILAKILNCKGLKGSMPCSKCEQCKSIDKGNNLDVIEMDAASHRGIDDVRTLRDAVKLAPVTAAKKIYIIDEAHMLTTEASNALLKTLEEPPDHVVFILATTNPEKLIETIRSRVTNIQFRKAKTEEIVNSLKRVAKEEKIKITDEALTSIAKSSDGAFRDAIKILEQLVSEGKDLTKENLEEYLFSKKAYDIDKFIGLLIKKDVKALVEEIGKFDVKGVAVESFLESLLGTLRLSLLAKVGLGEDGLKDLSKENLIELIDLLVQASNEINNSPIEELPLEIAVIKWCGEENGDSSQTAHLKQNSHSTDGGVGDNIQSTSADSESVKILDVSLVNNDAQTSDSIVHSQGNSTPELVVNDDAWRMVLSLVKPINATIEALLRAARPITYDGKILTLGVFYKFHKERLEDPRYRKILEDVVAKVLQSPTRVVCTLMEAPPRVIINEVKNETVLTEAGDKDIIKVAEEIFGN